jgi:hypothetical protein
MQGWRRDGATTRQALPNLVISRYVISYYLAAAW